MIPEQFINEFLDDLPPLKKAKAVTHLLSMTDCGLTGRDIDYLITLHNVNVAGIHYPFSDPIAEKDIKTKLQNLKNKLQ